LSSPNDLSLWQIIPQCEYADTQGTWARCKLELGEHSTPNSWWSIQLIYPVWVFAIVNDLYGLTEHW